MTFLQHLASGSLWSTVGATLVGGVLSWGLVLSPRSMAAESLVLRWGPLSQTVSMTALDDFVATGAVPPSLWLYRPFLTPTLQASLRSEIALDPAVVEVILEEIVQSPSGHQLLATLNALVPNLDVANLRVALEQVVRAEQPLTVINLLRQLPQDTLDIELGALLSWVAQFQFEKMENAALGRLLHEDLASKPSRPKATGSVDPFSTGPYPVERWELVLRDRSRDRSIPVDIYWSEHTQGPLVVVSHGFGADRRFFAYLAQHLASHGLTVVAVEHPGSNVAALFSSPATQERTKPSGSRLLPATEFLDRPRDISYVLDRMEKLNLYSYSLRDRFNTQQVTLIGHSLGGYTGLALAGAPLDLRRLSQTCQSLNPVQLSPSDWLQCAALDLPVKYANLKDNRITQLIVINPLTGLLFGETGLNRVQVPTLMLAATQDSVTPMARQQLSPFTQLRGPKYLLTAIGGSHLSVGDPKNLNADLRYIPFMPALPDAGTSSLRIFLQGISLSFVMQQTTAATAYAGFLSAQSAQAFSTPELPIEFNQTLPDSLSTWARLQPEAANQPVSWLDLGLSLAHLEVIALQGQLQLLQHQMVTHLKTSPPALTALSWPRPMPGAQIQAHQPNRNHAAP